MQSVVIEWKAGAGFLLPRLLPDARWISLPSLSGPIPARVQEALQPGALAIFQINLSNSRSVPTWRSDFVRRVQSLSGTVLNSSVNDIRKSSLHRRLKRLGLNSTLVGRDDSVERRVIVKSDLNYGGLFERVDGVLSSPLPSFVPGALNYPVLRLRDVPQAWFKSRHLVVERFIGNRRGRFHRAYVLGDHIVIVQAYARGAIKKLEPNPRNMSFFFSRDELPRVSRSGTVGFTPKDVIAQLAGFLAGVNLDFGAIDFVNDGRKAFIVDLNLTPYGPALPSGDAEPLLFLKLGLRRYSAKVRRSG